MTSNLPTKTLLLSGAGLVLAMCALPALTQDFLESNSQPPTAEQVSVTATGDAGVQLNATPLPYALVAGDSKAYTTPMAAASAQALPLSPEDTALYRTAFAQIDAGNFTAAEASLAQVKDTRLMGYARFHKLFNRRYTSTYSELMAWLDVYGDQPMAMRVWGLAKRKKPDGAPDPAFPSIKGAGVQLLATTSLTDERPHATLNPGVPANESLTPKSARSAYNNGQLDQAVKLGRQIGDHWVVGLASWRLGRFDQAMAAFKFVASDPSQNAWSQSGGAYWAGRCALKLEQKDEADSYFRIAASFPFTFYGLVAEQRLGVTPAVVLARKGQSPTFSSDARHALTAALDADFTWAETHPRAQRLNALIQVGRVDDAQDELQAAVQTSVSPDDRDRWLALSARVKIPVSPLKSTDRLFDASLYPTPDFAPKGGFTVPRALILAVARKESKFNPKAFSYSGAYGLLQLMPATAAMIENDPSLAAKPAQLLAPEVNLRVGQNYIQRLYSSKIIESDLLRTLAAYNAGPRPVKDAVESLGPEADSLLMMESIPVAQTRQYVEEVAANYWIYRQLMGQPTKTLAMAASDARIIDAFADK